MRWIEIERVVVVNQFHSLIFLQVTSQDQDIVYFMFILIILFF
jgi:hypothetical protein